MAAVRKLSKAIVENILPHVIEMLDGAVTESVLFLCPGQAGRRPLNRS